MNESSSPFSHFLYTFVPRRYIAEDLIIFERFQKFTKIMSVAEAQAY